jgi:hypothetical protein
MFRSLPRVSHSRRGRRHTRHYGPLLTLILGLAISGRSAIAQEVLLFPSLTAIRMTETGKAANSDLDLAGSLFFSKDFGRLRFLAEVLVNKNEKEVERAQIGWKFSSNTTIWAGRFHTPLGFWNTEYHHGAYLQTSIDRPKIAQYEDEGGLLPLHGTGLLLQTTRRFGDSLLSVDAGLASGPTIEGNDLEPVAFLRPQRFGKVGLSAKVAWQPDATSPTQLGGSFASFDLPIAGAPADQISQIVINGFVNWESGPWRLLGEAYLIRHRAKEAGLLNRSVMTSTYVQGDYRFGDRWSGYTRLENNQGVNSDALISRNPGFARHNVVLGTRVELPANFAMKLELAAQKRFDGTTGRYLGLQFSTVLK